MLNNLQKLGGVAALINGAAYIVGIGMVATLLAPIMNASPEEYVDFLVSNQTLMSLWHLIIYLVAGVFMVPMVLGLHERLKDGSPALMQITTAFGLIWTVTVIGSGMIIIHNIGVIVDLYGKDPSQALTVWSSISTIEEGLGGAIELPGGLWILLVSLVALQSAKLPKLLNYCGIVIGMSGIITVVPSFYMVGYVFGLGAIVWFVWVGIVMIRNKRN